MKLELRATTNSHLMQDNPAMMFSTMPSAKYSCLGSPLKFENGSTATDGLSGNASAGDVCGFASADGLPVATNGPT
ncbi:hypothetical protein UP06_07075 [Bradyrhizobium sp. LTSP857]|nr:hypothetical protein UP06_07075 [Bradyrhizobium sp. LTSP857]